MNVRRKYPARRRKDPSHAKDDPVDHAVRIVFPICCVAGSLQLLNSDDADAKGLRTAIVTKNTPALFNWLVRVIALQGVSDRAAITFMRVHGAPTWNGIRATLNRPNACPLLRSYWHYEGCKYSKSKQTCSRPKHFAACGLPRMVLRNGRLNQTSFALFLLVRDVMDGNIVAWIHHRLAPSHPNSERQQRERVIGPLREVIGLADKVISMTLSTLLLAAPNGWKRWRAVGGSMIAIDTLVHKFMHRTGILHRFKSDHEFGAACYRKTGCAEIVEQIACRIDASEFNNRYPQRFGRWVQHAIWSWCAMDGNAECNSVRIKDRTRCANIYCRVYGRCERRPVSKTYYSVKNENRLNQGSFAEPFSIKGTENVEEEDRQSESRIIDHNSSASHCGDDIQAQIVDACLWTR